MCHFPNDRPVFVLLTIHQLQAEVTRVFSAFDLKKEPNDPALFKSVLFPHVSDWTIDQLKSVYDYKNQKTSKVKGRMRGESILDCASQIYQAVRRRHSSTKIKSQLSHFHSGRSTSFKESMRSLVHRWCTHCSSFRTSCTRDRHTIQ